MDMHISWDEGLQWAKMKAAACDISGLKYAKTMPVSERQGHCHNRQLARYWMVNLLGSRGSSRLKQIYDVHQ